MESQQVCSQPGLGLVTPQQCLGCTVKREEVAETQEAKPRLNKLALSKPKERPPECICVFFNVIKRKYNYNFLPDFLPTVEEKKNF